MQMKLDLDKCKVPELKAVAKKHKIKISGTKKVLLERIKAHIIRENAAITIQRVFRGYMVRYVFTHMGPAHKNRALCVNECDGCTLEPLSAIPLERFYSCKDEKEIVYGFDIISLLTMYRKCNTINPYTRETMKRDTVNIVKTLGRRILILFPEVIDKGERDVIDMSPPVINRPSRNTNSSQPPVHLYRPQYGNEVPPNRIIRSGNRTIIFNAVTRQISESNHLDLFLFMCRDEFTDAEYTILNKLIDIHRLPIQQRIRDVFIEIDLLGNYTQSSWFANLSITEYCHFFSHLYDIWNYRANMSMEIKQQICILYDPFMNLRIPNPHTADMRVRELCTSVIENIVYGSPDPEYRKLGCMHILTALTLVSREARHNLYWLYESII